MPCSCLPEGPNRCGLAYRQTLCASDAGRPLVPTERPLGLSSEHITGTPNDAQEGYSTNPWKGTASAVLAVLMPHGYWLTVTGLAGLKTGPSVGFWI